MQSWVLCPQAGGRKRDCRLVQYIHFQRAAAQQREDREDNPPGPGARAQEPLSEVKKRPRSWDMLIPSRQSPRKVQRASRELAGGIFPRSVLSSLKNEEASPLCGEQDLLKQARPQTRPAEAGWSRRSLLNPGLCPLLKLHL